MESLGFFLKCCGFGKKIFGKPKDQADAIEMLSELQNQTHEVITGLAVIRGEKILTAVEKTAELPRIL